MATLFKNMSRISILKHVLESLDLDTLFPFTIHAIQYPAYGYLLTLFQNSAQFRLFLFSDNLKSSIPSFPLNGIFLIPQSFYTVHSIRTSQSFQSFRATLHYTELSHYTEPKFSYT